MASERILIVDDDPAILALCQRILGADGYTVVEAKRGEEAIAKLETEAFDLLLTDIRLPGLNGLEVAARLRDRGLELTVVTMTGYSNMEMAIQALSLGVDEFLVKPFTLESLRVTISRALEKSRLRRENARLRTLVPLLQISQMLASTRTREQVFIHLFAAARDLLRTRDLALLEVGQDQQTFTLAQGEGEAMTSLRDGVWSATHVPEVNEFLRKVRVWSSNGTGHLPFQLKNVSSLVSAPLVAHERTRAVFLAAVSEQPSQSDLEALHLVAGQAAGALENVDLIGEISRAFVSAREVERLKSEFINIAGHEVRTPLALLKGYASLLNERLDGELQSFASEVLTHAQRLQRIVDDMLNLKHLEEGHVELRLERCAIDQVVREVISAYRPLARERQQSIEMEPGTPPGNIVADRSMLDLMLGSLISNAIKFSPRQTRVRVAVRGDERQVTLQVRDQGKGLTSEQATKVFDAFYQAGSSLTRAEGGLGLGLTITREMVRAHGGTIWVESEHGGGSSFYISLPRDSSSAG